MLLTRPYQGEEGDVKGKEPPQFIEEKLLPGRGAQA